MDKAVMKVSLVALLLLLPLTGWSQDEIQKPTLAFQKAEDFRHAAHLDSSNAYFQKAAQLFEESGHRDQQIVSLYKLSLNALEQGNQDEAQKLLESAFSLHQKHQPQDTLFRIKYYLQKGLIAEARAEYDRAVIEYQKGMKLADQSGKYAKQKVSLTISLGEVSLARGKHEKALDQFNNAEELYHRNHVEDQRLLSRLYNSIGILYKEQGAWKDAKTYFQKSLEIDKKTLPSPHPQLAKTNNNLATTYYYQSDYQHALDHMKNAVSVLAEFYGENHRLVAAGYNNLGVVYSMTDQFDEATAYLKKALEIKEIVLGKDHPEVAIGYMNLGAIYSDMQQYDQAIKNYRISQRINLKHFPEGHPELADVYANLGQAYAKKGAYEKALDYYHKDLDINRKLLDENHPFIGDTYTKIGETYAMNENYDMALNYYQRTLAIVVKGFSEENGYQNPPLDKVAYPDLLLQTLELKADALSNYFDTSGKQHLLEKSLQTYLQAVQLIDKLQSSYDREKSKFLLRERTVDIYKKGVAVAYKLHKQTGNADYKEYTFYFAEKSRNQILLEQIQQLNAQELADLPDSLIAHENALRLRVTDLQEQLSGLTVSPKKDDTLHRIAIQDSLFQAREKLDKHISQLESSYPKYYQLKYAPVVTRASDIQQDLISPNQTVLSYFFGQDDLFAFVVTKDSFNIRKLPADSLLKEKVMAFRKSIVETSSATNFENTSHNLYRKILEPVADLIAGQQLLIIPDGVLHYLPFESLVNRAPSQSPKKRFRKLPYMINDYTISYAPSAGYLELHNRQLAPQNQKQLVGFAPVFQNINTAQTRALYPEYKRPISALPLSKKEVQQLGSLYNQPKGLLSFLKSKKEEADIFLEEQATESVFKELPLESYRYIHLATHAYMLEENAHKSGILFAAPESGKEDGTLHASEIYTLGLNAELITLSACNTGVGALARGEGMMSLSRAFQYAGANNLLVSLWNVDDRSTAELMVDFYEQNQEGKPLPGALQQAKINMIHKSQYAHPKYWAPFIFMGQ